MGIKPLFFRSKGYKKIRREYGELFDKGYRVLGNFDRTILDNVREENKFNRLYNSQGREIEIKEKTYGLDGKEESGAVVVFVRDSV